MNFTNISVLNSCKITYITQTADTQLMIAIILLLIIYVIVFGLFEFKLRENYARFFKRKLYELQDTHTKNKD